MHTASDHRAMTGLIGRFILVSGLLSSTLLRAVIQAQSPPDLINYQGTLLRPDGSPEIGPKSLEFRILDEGSTIVWGPQTFPDLALQQGKFNVLLGATDDDGSTITLAFQGRGDAARYMSVRVAGEPTERLPLQRIASVPFAMSVPDGSVTPQKLVPPTVVTATASAPSPYVINKESFALIPGLLLTLPLSGDGRPVVVKLRSTNPTQTSVIVKNCGEQVGLGFYLELTGMDSERKEYRLDTGRQEMPVQEVEFFFIPPAGLESVDCALAAYWNASDPGCSTTIECSGNGRLQLVAVELR